MKRSSATNIVANSEYNVSNFIPYYCHWDSKTLLTKNRDLLQVIKVEGFPFETADDDELDLKKQVRNSMLRSMGTGNFALWFHTIRRKKSAFPKGIMPKGFPDYVNDVWRDKHSNEETFVNELYITILHKSDTKGLAKIENWVKKIYEAADKGSREESLKEAHKALEETVQRVLASLREYGARVLQVKETEVGTFSEPCEFLASIVNCIDSTQMLAPSMDISEYLATNRLYFGPKAIEVRGANRHKFAAMISVKEYPNSTAAGMMDSFLLLPFEFIISQSFSFTNRQVSMEKMQTQQNRMIQSGDRAISQIAEISEALDLTMSGHVGFGEHHCTVMCIEDNLKSMEKAVALCISEMVSAGINPVREKMNMQAAFWAQLPSNYRFIARKASINTLNMASFASLHNYPIGSIANNHWGNAVSVLDTTSGSPYFFNFHSNDVGHTTIIGPTGAGKTVLMNFLCAQAQKFEPRMFFFDKDRGAEIFIRALDGDYTIVEPSDRCRFNPLQLPDNYDNRAFILEWLKALATSNGEKINSDDILKLENAVDGNYKLEKKDRKLSNIAPFFGLETPDSLAGKIRMWHGFGQFAEIFDNDNDSLDLDNGRIFGFEMGPILANKVTLAPVLLYLFHRIQLALDGKPTMIVLDEAWALIDNDIFAPKIRDWLKTLRKLNAIVIFATQSVEDATKSAISDTLVQQTATQIFLPNSKATADYQRTFMLSDREFQIIKTTDVSTRYFLLKHGNDIVVARVDLNGMDDIVQVLSGRAETVVILDRVRKEHGDDPRIWIGEFLEELNKEKALQAEKDKEEEPRRR